MNVRPIPTCAIQTLPVTTLLGAMCVSAMKGSLGMAWIAQVRFCTCVQVAMCVYMCICESVTMSFYTHSDIDECSMDVCHVNATCSNTAGSYECTCLSGFSGDGLTCTGSCSNNKVYHSVCKYLLAFPLHSSQTLHCIDLMGYCSTSRKACNPYLTLPSADINECEVGTDSCDENAECNNTDGSYTCSCNTGYSGDGQSCMGMLWGYKSQ